MKIILLDKPVRMHTSDTKKKNKNKKCKEKKNSFSRIKFSLSEMTRKFKIRGRGHQM